MTRRLHVWPEQAVRRDGVVESRARVEGARAEPLDLVFRVPREAGASITEAADPFLLATTFSALRAGTDLEIHGPVSPSLLRGLEEFQSAWCSWRPDRYRRFDVHAETEREADRTGPAPSVLTFSGGLDSCFSAWRHTRGDGGDSRCDLRAAVMVHGFDIPLVERDTFARAAGRSRRILDSIGVHLITVETNVRDLEDDWEDAHGAALAACLHLVAASYGTGLIASSHTYDTLRFPWGSNPVTDPLLSSRAMAIVHDGADRGRMGKARAIRSWEDALENLRVCWQGERLDENCGVCLRCVGTALCFSGEGLPTPPSLSVPSAEEAVRRLRSLVPSRVQLGRLEEIAARARVRVIAEPWVGNLERFVRHQRLRGRWRRLRALAALRHREPRAGGTAPGILPVSSPTLYEQANRSINDRLGVSLGLAALLRTGSYPLDGRALEGHHRRYAVIRRFQRQTLDLFRASLRGDADPAIAEMVVGEAPREFAAEYHRALTEHQHRPPVFFRTDELGSGKLSEIQCSGSGWGLVDQIRELYDAREDVFGAASEFVEKPAHWFANALRRHLDREPVVHHLADNASRPHGVRYFIQKLRDEGIPFFGYDRGVRPRDCNFIRAHDFVSLAYHNFFADRMERCNRGDVCFDLPPSLLFDGKLILAWPFWRGTRDAYDDEVRSLFPHTDILEPDGVTLRDGQRVTLEEFCDIPRRRRTYYLKYAGTDIASNWGSKSVFLASTMSPPRCRRMVEDILSDRQRKRYWILQEAVRRAEATSAFGLDGGVLETKAYTKLSSFYGPGGLMSILVMQLRSHKVHGSPDTIVSLVR